MLKRLRVSEGDLTRLRARPGDPLSIVANVWDEVVFDGPYGGFLARNSRPTRLEGTTLWVTSTSAGLSHELQAQASDLVAKIRERYPSSPVEQLRFRIGHVAPRAGRGERPETHPSRRVKARPAAATLDETLARFAAEVEAARRAKAAAGWNDCEGCSVPIAPDAGRRCPSCANAFAQQRERRIAQLLFEAPWLGYDGTADLVEDLRPDEYGAIRRRLLARWWDTLVRAAAAGRLSRDARERAIASSYVILKSGVAPERIAPATVRAVLGDAIHDLIYGTEQR